VSNVGPGPSATNGTVTTHASTPNTRIGTKATSSVEIRLFTATNVRFALGVTCRATRLRPGEYR